MPPFLTVRLSRGLCPSIKLRELIISSSSPQPTTRPLIPYGSWLVCCLGRCAGRRWICVGGSGRCQGIFCRCASRSRRARRPGAWTCRCACAAHPPPSLVLEQCLRLEPLRGGLVRGSG